MKNVLYPLTYLGLCPFAIVLARALHAKQTFQPTFVAMTPAEVRFARNNISSDALVVGLDHDTHPGGDVLQMDDQYHAVYGFMKAKYGGSDEVWRHRVNLIYRKIEQVVVERKIEWIVMWNGNDCMGKVCQLLAKKHCLKTLYLENGYFPNTLQIDPKGVNAQASVSGLSASEWNQGVDFIRGDITDTFCEPVRPSRVIHLSPLQRFLLKLSAWFDWNYFERYPELRDQKARKQVKTSLKFSLASDVLGKNRPFALVVLQVHDDTQILLNSRLFNSPKDFLGHCYESIREVFGPTYDIVVKLHPVDINRISYADLASTMQGVFWIGAEPVEPLLDACEFVMVINSSVGLQSIAMLKPTVVFGDSFYSRSEVCSVVNSPSQTIVVLNEFKSGGGRKDPFVVNRFVEHMRKRYFVPGSWKLGAHTDLEPVMRKIQQILAASDI